MRAFAALLLAFSTNVTALAAPPEPAPPPKGGKGDKPAEPAEPQPSCKLLTPEAPRGGMLEVQGEGFGKTPLVRIAGKVTRTIERRDDRISVQIPRDSNGGEVTVQVGKARIVCGTLTIIGKD